MSYKIFVGKDTPLEFFANIPSFTDRQQLIAPGVNPYFIGTWEGLEVYWSEIEPPASSAEFLYGYLFGYLKGIVYCVDGSRSSQEALGATPLPTLTTPTHPLSDGLSRTVEGP